MKIAVVGCSFAGLSFSYFLSKKESDIDLTLFDRKKEIGAIRTSACCTTLGILRELNVEKSALVRTYKGMIHYNGKDFEYNTEGYVTFDYKKLCTLLSRQTDGSFRLKSNVDIEKLKDEYDIVIDASGWSSRIDRNKKLAFGMECEIELDDLDSSMTHLFVGKDIIEGGYGWAFPISKKRFRVGVGGYEKSDFSKKLDEFLLNKFDSKRTETVGGFIAYGLSKNIVKDNIICLGDSASMTLPITYEGIRPAVLYSKILSGLVYDYHLGKISFDELVRTYLRKTKRDVLYSAFLKSEGMFLNPNFLTFQLIKCILSYYGRDFKAKRQIHRQAKIR
jgi:flavin-dependent dehydrogenase